MAAGRAVGLPLPGGEWRTMPAPKRPSASPKQASLGKWADDTIRCEAAISANSAKKFRPRGYFQARPAARPAAIAECPEGKLLTFELLPVIVSITASLKDSQTFVWVAKSAALGRTLSTRSLMRSARIPPVKAAPRIRAKSA